MSRVPVKDLYYCVECHVEYTSHERYEKHVAKNHSGVAATVHAPVVDVTTPQRGDNSDAVSDDETVILKNKTYNDNNGITRQRLPSTKKTKQSDETHADDDTESFDVYAFPEAKKARRVYSSQRSLDLLKEKVTAKAPSSVVSKSLLTPVSDGGLSPAATTTTTRELIDSGDRFAGYRATIREFNESVLACLPETPPAATADVDEVTRYANEVVEIQAAFEECRNIGTEAMIALSRAIAHRAREATLLVIETAKKRTPE